MIESSPAAGWYPDPGGTPGQRYFDGTDWTEHQAALPADRIMSDDVRAEILNQALATAVARGGRIKLSHTRFQAVIVYGRPINRTLGTVGP
jgi:hypothetical protein